MNQNRITEKTNAKNARPHSIRNLIIIKTFTGEPRTGGELIVNEIIASLKDEPNVLIIKPFENLKKIDGSRLSVGIKEIIRRFYFVVKINSLSLRYIKQGHEVYCDSPVASVRYLQPPVRLRKAMKVQTILVDKFVNFFDSLTRRGKNNLKLVIYNSRYSIENFKVRKKDIIEHILYPCIPNLIENNSESSIKEDMFITLSRIVPHKNLEEIENIITDIPYQHYLIGYNSNKVYLDHIRNTLKKSIVIPNVSDEMKQDFLRRAKLMLHTSINEPAGIVFMESLANGVIPLAHKSGGALEIVPSEFLWDSPLEAAEKIKYFMQTYNDETYNKLKLLSKRYDCETFKIRFREIVISYLENFSRDHNL
jgi:glycosyltransferase involved in cell wall biosynthesis